MANIQRKRDRIIKKLKQEQTENQVFLANRALFAQTLIFNVIGRYDDKLLKLLATYGNSQIYEYKSTQGEWIKLSIKGPLVLYSRDCQSDGFHAGIIVLNKENIENFSIGIMTEKKSLILGKEVMKVENTDTLTVVKNCEGVAYGIWIEEDKEQLRGLIQALIYNDTTAPIIE